jgi:hypothetical protein
MYVQSSKISNGEEPVVVHNKKEKPTAKDAEEDM